MKTALVTGGTKGIGKGIARVLLENGYEVALNYDRDERTAMQTQREFNLLGYCPVLLKADVSSEAAVKSMFREFFETYDSLDLLVNNAGISIVKVLQDTTLEDYNRLFSVNMLGTFLCSKEAILRMIPSRGGSIVNIASIWGEVGASCETVYSATKGAVISFTKALSKELAPSNIRVNCISPGVIDTDMNADLSPMEMEDLINSIPLERMGRPEEIGEAVLYLAEARYVTGVNIPVGGGFAK
ncbi:MAG: SDR family oxidoreductase [Clostridia bacterium]|nr:SDR family oxidoreductase [Clostridia bacterium]